LSAAADTDAAEPVRRPGRILLEAVMTTRRLVLGALGAGLVAACTRQPKTQYVEPSGPQVVAAEAARRPGIVRDFGLTAETAEIDLGGTVVPTWRYGGQVPGRPIRVAAGEQVRVTVDNHLPEATSVHWHGLTLRNDADGVPGVTQAPIDPGGRFIYQFTAPHPGTYWFHPHHGLQLDRGLYAPLIVDDLHEPLRYDREWIVVLDDWLDGVAGTPDDAYARVRDRGGMRTGIAAAAIDYPYFLLNGRVPNDPNVLRARPGDRVRLRIINAGATTAFRFGVTGHQMTVTHTDGRVVEPTVTDSVTIAMGERYDALVTVGAGAFPAIAVPIAARPGSFAAGLIRTAPGTAPPPDAAMVGLRTLTAAQLQPAESARLADRQPDRTLKIAMTGGMMSYDWRFDGKAYDPERIDHAVRAGERVLLELANRTMMWHPIHLHGHVFALGGPNGALKDTATVSAGSTLRIVFDADNPGRWMLHCHNAYHAEAGMMTLIGYEAQ
jgi:multicopper oxidase